MKTVTQNDSNMTKNGVTKFQIEDLKVDVESLKKDVKKILENHLPHIKEDITKLSANISRVKDSQRNQTYIMVAILLSLIGLIFEHAF